jgi:hypothetical protein
METSMLRLKLRGNKLDLRLDKPTANHHAERIARDAKHAARRERDNRFIHHTKGERK